MKKRSTRIEALLGELMPLAHAVADNLEPGPDMSRLLDWLFEVLADQDSQAFTTVFEGTSINPKNQTTRHEETRRGSKMDFLSRFLILL